MYIPVFQLNVGVSCCNCIVFVMSFQNKNRVTCGGRNVCHTQPLLWHHLYPDHNYYYSIESLTWPPKQDIAPIHDVSLLQFASVALTSCSFASAMSAMPLERNLGWNGQFFLTLGEILPVVKVSTHGKNYIHYYVNDLLTHLSHRHNFLVFIYDYIWNDHY